MANKVLKTTKPVAFETIEDASVYIAGLSDGDYEIEVSTKRTEFVLNFTDAMSARCNIAKRLKIDEPVLFDWRLIGPATYSISIIGNKNIPISWKTKSDDLRDRIELMKDGERLDCSDLGYDTFYIRVVLSKLGVQAYTKTENGIVYIIRGAKPLSGLKTIRAFAEALSDEPQILHVDKSVQYVRTNLSAIKKDGFSFSVKQITPGQYLVSKRPNRPAKTESGSLSERDRLVGLLSDSDLAAYDSIMRRAEVAKRSTPCIVPALEEMPADDNVVLESDILAYENGISEKTAAALADTEFIESAPCYMIPEEINVAASALDDDDWSADKLNTDYLKNVFGDDDDDDLPF